MKRKHKAMLKQISCLKEKALFISLCESSKTTEHLIKNFGHRFSKYICDIRNRFGYECIQRLHISDKKYLYWI